MLPWSRDFETKWTSEFGVIHGAVDSSKIKRGFSIMGDLLFHGLRRGLRVQEMPKMSHEPGSALIEHLREHLAS